MSEAPKATDPHKPRRRAPAKPMDRLTAQLRAMGARMPSTDETAALRALMRGTASEGQQRAAVAYIMAELCGVGSVPFTGESSHATAFRAGSLAVGIAMGAIADVVIMSFPKMEEGSERVAG
jgi:hypothetical protein